MKEGYFRLLSDNMISEIIPHAVYNPEDETYDLHLKVKLENNFAVRLGGNISTSNSNQIYLGLSYQDLNYYAKELLLTDNLGKSIIMHNLWQRLTFYGNPNLLPFYRIHHNF